MKSSAVSPLLRDATRIGLGLWAIMLGMQSLSEISGLQDSTTFLSGSLLSLTGILFIFKKMGMVATLIGTISLFMMRLDVGLWAWIWLLWPTAKLYGDRRKVFTFGFWYLIFLHVWRCQHNPDGWWSSAELVLSVLAAVPLFTPWAWASLVTLLLLIAPFDSDWNIPLIAMHMLTFNMNWIKAVPLPIQPIVRIDTRCLYCNKFLDLLIREDREDLFLFGEAHPGATHLTVESATGVHVGWNAIIYICSQLGGYWIWISKLLALVPTTLGERLYYFVAVNRYRIFKPSKDCRPRPELGKRWIQKKTSIQAPDDQAGK